MKYAHLKLRVLDGKFKYILLKDGNSIQRLLSGLDKKSPVAFFLAADEASAIVPEEVSVPVVKAEPEWRCIRVVGEMPFGTVQGLIATISSSLKEENIGICVISTFLTDWFFIKGKNIDSAVERLKKDGWEFAK